MILFTLEQWVTLGVMFSLAVFKLYKENTIVSRHLDTERKRDQYCLISSYIGILVLTYVWITNGDFSSDII